MTTSRSGFADLAGQTALVTGAGSDSGIGFACARFLGRLGADVVVTAPTDRIQRRVAELRTAGVSASGLVADLTAPGRVDRLAREVLDRHGRISVLVKSARSTSVSVP